MRNASAESRREEIARAMRVRDHDAIIASHYNVSLISVAAFVMSLDEHEADRQKLRSIECLRGAFGPVEDENKHPYQNLHPGTCLHVLAAELLLEHMRTELGAQTNPPSPKLRELPSTLVAHHCANETFLDLLRSSDPALRFSSSAESATTATAPLSTTAPPPSVSSSATACDFETTVFTESHKTFSVRSRWTKHKSTNLCSKKSDQRCFSRFTCL